MAPEESPSPLQKRWVVNRVKEGGNIWWLLKNTPSPLQKRWVVNRFKEGGNIWWLLKNLPPLPPSEEMGGEQG